MTTTPPTAAKSKTKRRWYQCSVRAVLIGVAVLSLPLGWFEMKVREVRQQAAAIAATEKSGGTVYYDYEFDATGTGVTNDGIPGPVWLRTLLGNGFFRNVYAVAPRGPLLTAADWENLRNFPQLRRLSLAYKQVTDAELVHIKDMTQLTTLWLDGTPVTDVGLVNLKGLTHLTLLNLQRTKVTDIGLEQLKRLTALDKLDLGYTKVTDAGMKKLQAALPNCSIYH